MRTDVADADTATVETAELRAFALSVLGHEGLDETATVSIELVSPETMAGLNKEHMGIDGATDVLSFPIEDASPGHPPVRLPGGPRLELGDVVLCLEVIERHALDHGVSLQSELHLMVVHGVLHILGWDHQTDTEAEHMEKREAEHLSRAGLERR